MGQEHHDRLRNILNTEVEWKIGGRSLDLWEKELIHDLVSSKFDDLSPYAKLLASEKAYRDFKGEFPLPVKIWMIRSGRGIESVKEYMDSVLPDEIAFEEDKETLILFMKELPEADFRIVDISCDLEAQVYQDVSIYVSYPIFDLEEVYPAYRSLRALIPIAKALPNPDNVYECEKMMLPSILHHLSEDNITDLQRSLKRVKALPLDQDLINTAIEFLNNDLNVTETAGRLYIHRNTLLYRLGKIKAQTGYDIRNFMDAVNFFLLYLIKILMR
jgi:sugar diacid utilization regulator